MKRRAPGDLVVVNAKAKPMQWGEGQVHLVTPGREGVVLSIAYQRPSRGRQWVRVRFLGKVGRKGERHVQGEAVVPSSWLDVVDRGREESP